MFRSVEEEDEYTNKTYNKTPIIEELKSMKLGMKKGKVVWLKADGTPSEMRVSTKKTIVSYGFPKPPGETIKFLMVTL